MKDIEERAREWCNGIINRRDTSDLERGYIQGAVEQKSIDIDKACEWLDYHLLDYHIGEQQVNKVIKEFRKAMEAESGDSCKSGKNLQKTCNKLAKDLQKEFIWHNASEELPEEDNEVIVIYDEGFICYNHRPEKKRWYKLNGKKVSYKPRMDEDGWADIHAGHKVVFWTEIPKIKEERK